MAIVKFTETQLKLTGKKGILKPDENGYYTLIIGGLNTFNSAGEYYTLDGAKALFESSSPFMGRITNGCLKGEVGHPKKAPGMTMDDYLNRILTIDETNVCCHFKEIWLDENFGRTHPEYNNQSMVAILAKVKPAGPKGQYLKEAIENPDENVCFSIRALTNDFYSKGVTNRVLQTIVCFDWVHRGGINIAQQWASPGLESLSEIVITKSQLVKMKSDPNLVATEDSKEILNECLGSFNKVPSSSVVYDRW